MLLYRADEAGNKTNPERFHSDGLLTKQVNSGDDPNPHLKYGWLNTIKSHINPETHRQHLLYDMSAYLSCTSKYSVAEHYLKTKHNYSILPVQRREDARAFLFEFQIDDSRLAAAGTGLFLYTFTCNYKRGETDPRFSSILGHYANCNICSRKEHYKHQLLMIDAATFLKQIKGLYRQEYENAERDCEWILLPVDPMLDGRGFQARIPIADFWSVNFFRYL